MAIEPIGARTVSAQIIPASVGSLEIGYGPNSLSPAFASVPVFSYNDSMWIMSSYNFSVTVNLTYQPGPRLVIYAASETIQPNTISLLYTFSGVAEQNWTLTASGAFGQNLSLSIPITYVAPSSILGPKGSFSAYLSNKQLAVNFSYSEQNSYNAQACFLGQNLISNVIIPFPSDLGTGQINISEYPNFDFAQLAVTGISKPFTFWFELYYAYSYAESSSTGLVSSQVETSISAPTLFSNSFGSNATLGVLVQNNVALRPGRYLLRAFFDDAGNVSVSQTNVLILNTATGSWIWLGGCYQSTQNSPTNFTGLTSIAKAPSAGPRNLFLMYDVQGVEFYSTFVLNVPVAKVVFTTSPYNGAISSVGVSLVSNQAISSVEFVDGIMYLLSSQFPVDVEFNFTFAGETFTTGETMASPATGSTINIPLSQIMVNVTNNGQALSGVNATLRRGSSTLLNVTTNKQGLAVFYVPAGNYSVSANYLGANQSKTILTMVDQNSTVVLPFSVSKVTQSPPDYSTPLIIILVIGVLGNLWIWVSLIRRKSRYF
ncbi:MAG: hypothetical protein ACRECH_02690 [Nitrososphaerales archaeon]